VTALINDTIVVVQYSVLHWLVFEKHSDLLTMTIGVLSAVLLMVQLPPFLSTY
jgi:hypothetical protein